MRRTWIEQPFGEEEIPRLEMAVLPALQRCLARVEEIDAALGSEQLERLGLMAEAGRAMAGSNKVVANGRNRMHDVVTCQVSVRDLKAHLSAWLGRVQAGEVVEVTSHRRPIARITAVKQVDPASSNPLQRAVDAGVISWSGQMPEFPPPLKLGDGGPLMSDIVMEERAQGQ